jgi:hypothetical protein
MAELQKVKYHAAGTLVLPENNTDRALVISYDRNYLFRMFSYHFKLLGGFSERDSSPQATINRECKEEVKKDRQSTSQRRYASRGLMDDLRREILNNSQEFGDFKIQIDENPISPPVKPYTYLLSAYVSSIDSPLFDEISCSLSERKQVTNEGLARIVTLDEFKDGKVRGAWGNASVVGKILEIVTPEYDFIKVDFFGNIRKSFKDYKTEFVYEMDPEKALPRCSRFHIIL